MGKNTYFFGLILLFTVCFCFHSRGQARLTKEDSLREKIYQIALGEVGLREPRGRNDHPRILDYHRSVNTYLATMKPVPPYCASFVNYCYKKAGAKVTKVDAPARARDWFKVDSRIVLTQQTLRGNQRMVRMPQKGDLVGYIFYGKTISHIEILEKIDVTEGYLYAIGANTSGDNAYNTVNREGDGVYYVRRKIKMFYKIADVLR